MSALSDSEKLTLHEKLTLQRFEWQEIKKTEDGHPFAFHLEGRLFVEKLLPLFAEFMSGPNAPSPPQGLEDTVCRLEPEQLAALALSPFVHALVTDMDEDEESPGMKVRLSVGRVFLDELAALEALPEGEPLRRPRRVHKKHQAAWQQDRWSDIQFVRVGDWLISCVVTRFPHLFVLDSDKVPHATIEGEKVALALVAEFVRRHPLYVPTTEPSSEWTDWQCGGYWDTGSLIRATFVRSHHPDIEATVKRAFSDGSIRPHADGVSAVQRVPFTINDTVLPVVERFAGKRGFGKRISKRRRKRDIAIAESLSGKKWWVPTNTDFRGRLFGVSDFNFQREDHVRSLFRFTQGMLLGDDGLFWLMVHTANCFDAKTDRGNISKRPFHERIAWIEDHRDQIMRVAQYPEANKSWWRKADAPFSFVAACMELTAAWKAGPRKFMTTLPVCFDGSCSGIQHLALMMRDEEAGRLVNLIPGDEVQDIYHVITDRVVKHLEAADDAKAGWWLRRGVTRKLVKRPAMTFAYSATIPGMQEQLDEVYAELYKDGRPDTFYLAGHIWQAAKEALPGPIRAMKFIRKLANERAAEGKVLEWTTPSGFPWSNRYHESNTKTLHLTSGPYFRCKVATSYKPELLKRKVLNAAAPNFTHALDASHLIRVVNAAARAGITDLVVVHDSFGCLAPQARAFNNVIRSELARLYHDRDVLDELRQAAGSTEPLPDRGRLNPWDVCHSQYAFA